MLTLSHSPVSACLCSQSVTTTASGRHVGCGNEIRQRASLGVPLIRRFVVNIERQRRWLSAANSLSCLLISQHFHRSQHLWLTVNAVIIAAYLRRKTRSWTWTHRVAFKLGISICIFFLKERGGRSRREVGDVSVRKCCLCMRPKISRNGIVQLK